MGTENTPQEGFSSMEEAVTALRNSRQPPEEQSEPETATEEPEADTEELTDEVREEAEVQDEGEIVNESENSAEEADDDADTEADNEEEALYEVEGETFTLSELQEWKKSGLRQADYTKKTQAIKAEREKFLSDQDVWTQQRDAELKAIQQQQAQLQDALAVFAIEQLDPPKRSDFPDIDKYIQAQEAYDTAQQRKQQAQQAYQAMQSEQMQATRQREAQQAMRYFPDWSTDDGFKAGLGRMTEVAKEFGFSQEEIMQGGLTDHRTWRILSKMADMAEALGDKQARAKAAAKKVVKTTRRITPSSKSSETESAVERRKARERLKETRSVNDAVALLRARRKG